MDYYMEKVYQEAFQTAYDHMLQRKKTDPDFTKEFLAGLLESLYVEQGNNWGRSEAKEQSQSAMIAVCEIILSDWDKL